MLQVLVDSFCTGAGSERVLTISAIDDWKPRYPRPEFAQCVGGCTHMLQVTNGMVDLKPLVHLARTQDHGSFQARRWITCIYGQPHAQVLQRPHCTIHMMDLLAVCTQNRKLDSLHNQLAVAMSWDMDQQMGRSLRIQSTDASPLTFQWDDISQAVSSRVLLEKTLLRHVLGSVEATKVSSHNRQQL